jgi:hypothetical protein
MLPHILAFGGVVSDWGFRPISVLPELLVLGCV